MSDREFHKQLYKHNPDAQIFGDCWRTCIANIIGLKPWEVPHFVLMDDDRAEEIWLRERGLNIYTFNCDAGLSESLQILSSLAPGELFILGGESSNRVNHAVLAKDGNIVFDPSLDCSGIIGPLKRNKTYGGTFILPEETSEMIKLKGGE